MPLCVEIPPLPKVDYLRVNPYFESDYLAPRVWNDVISAVNKHAVIIWQDAWSATAKKDGIMITVALFAIEDGLRVDFIHNMGNELEFIALARCLRAECVEIDRDAQHLEQGGLFE